MPFSPYLLYVYIIFVGVTKCISSKSTAPLALVLIKPFHRDNVRSMTFMLTSSVRKNTTATLQSGLLAQWFNAFLILFDVAVSAAPISNDSLSHDPSIYFFPTSLPISDSSIIVCPSLKATSRTVFSYHPLFGSKLWLMCVAFKPRVSLSKTTSVYSGLLKYSI